MAPTDQNCVFLWAVPRSLSTVMTKCMSFVDGVQVWHEPYQFTYHKEKMMAMAASTDPRDQFVMKVVRRRPEDFTQGAEDLPKGKLIDIQYFGYPWLKEQLETQDKDKKLIFVKDIGFLLHGKYEFLPTERKYRHTFLIRDPRRVYTSLKKLFGATTTGEYKNMSFDLRFYPFYDVSRIFQYHCDLWKYVKENLDNNPVILDATELAAQPEKLLPKYFDALGITWKEEYLTFDSTEDITREWKSSHQGFLNDKIVGTLKNALESTRFTPEADEFPSRETMTNDIIECIDEAMPFYDEMYEQRLKP